MKSGGHAPTPEFQAACDKIGLKPPIKVHPPKPERPKRTVKVPGPKHGAPMRIDSAIAVRRAARDHVYMVGTVSKKEEEARKLAAWLLQAEKVATK